MLGKNKTENGKAAKCRKLFSVTIIVAMVMGGFLGIVSTDTGSRNAEAYNSSTVATATHTRIFQQAGTILSNDGHTLIATFLSTGNTAVSYSATYDLDGNGEISYLETMIRSNVLNDGLLDGGDHYMDPDTHAAYTSSYTSAGNGAQTNFNTAVTYWNNGDRNLAMYYLGIACHMVQDLCVPHHARRTAVNGHSDYETWVDDNVDNYMVTSGGIYTFTAMTNHYTPSTAFGWVDYNAHYSYGLYPNVNSGDEALYATATSDLLPRAQKTTAGFIKFFFDSVDLSQMIVDSTVRAYDTNYSGRIEKSEAVQAVLDYFDYKITKQVAVAVVLAYFSG